MAQYLKNSTTGQTVYVDPSNPDYAGYIAGGFNPIINPPGTIAADGIQSVPQLDVGTPTPNTGSNNAMVAGASTVPTDIQSQINKQTEERNKEVTGVDALSKTVSDLLGQTAGQTEAKAQEILNSGAPQLETQLSEVNANILSGLAEYKQLKTDYDLWVQENRNKPVGMRFITGRETEAQFKQAMLLSQKAADIELLQAQASGLQGRIDTAKKQAEDAVTRRYAPILEQLDIKKQQLAIAYDTFTAKEKLRADELNRLYDEEQAQAEQSQLEEKNRVNFALDAMNKYRDAGITLDDDYETIQNKIQLSPTYKTDQAQEQASLSNTRRLAGGGGSAGIGFTPTEKKKLEQAGLTKAPRQEQLDYLYGKDATNNAQFYVDRIKEGSVDYLNDDGTINWPAVPAALRQEVFDALEADETEEISTPGFMDVVKEIPGAIKEIGGKIGGYVKSFFNLF